MHRAPAGEAGHIAEESLRGDRATQRRVLIVRDDEEALRSAIITLAERYGRYGYRRITALL